jgi:hypothetical protein
MSAEKSWDPLKPFCAGIEAQRQAEYQRGYEAGQRDEREAAAQIADACVGRIRGGRKRVNQVDEHTACVVEGIAAAIRARGETE